jgi:hypothetical protein
MGFKNVYEARRAGKAGKAGLVGKDSKQYGVSRKGKKLLTAYFIYDDQL